MQRVKAFIITYARDWTRWDYEDEDFIIQSAFNEQKRERIKIYHYDEKRAEVMLRAYLNKKRYDNIKILSIERSKSDAGKENMTPAYIQKQQDYINNMEDVIRC